MPFDHEKRIRLLEEIRRQRIQDEASLSPTTRLQMADELLSLSRSLHGPAPIEPWSLLLARRAKRTR